MNWRMIVAVGALFLTVLVWKADAHETPVFKHLTGTESMCGMEHYRGYVIWYLTEGRGYIAVVFSHGRVHATRPYKDLEELKRRLRGE